MKRGKTHSGRHTKETRGSGAEDVCELVCARCRTKASRLPMSRSSSMTAQLAAQRVHVLGEVLAGSLAG